MNRLIFGSTALKHWFPDYNREPKDIDYIGRGKSSREEEYHWVDSFSYILANNQDSKYVDPNFLYTIKVSHAAWDVKWDKTMSHIIFLKNHGCELDKALYQSLLKEWEKVHKSKKSIKLTGHNEDFFTDRITREFDHDWLHTHFAFYDRPLHTQIRRNLESPLCSEELWNRLTYEDKLRCALEETYVIARERYRDKPPRHAMIKAIKNLITSMTKGWFNLFMVENFKEMLDYDKTHYLNKWSEL